MFFISPNRKNYLDICITKRYFLIDQQIAPGYAADLSVPILDRGRNAKEREIGSSTMCRPNYYYLFTSRISANHDKGLDFSQLGNPYTP